LGIFAEAEGERAGKNKSQTVPEVNGKVVTRPCQTVGWPQFLLFILMSESPFVRQILRKKKKATIFRQLVDKFDEIFLDAIPSEDVKQLPPQYLYPLGLIVLTLLLGIFIALFVPGYEVQVRTKFLSPADASSDGRCTDVTISNTGVYLATKDGVWQGSSKFAYSKASYSLSATNLQLDAYAFRQNMDYTYSSIEAVGEKALSQSLPINLLYWMSWVSVVPGYSSERFSMTGMS
jgi:hypothetical protein